MEESAAMTQIWTVILTTRHAQWWIPRPVQQHVFPCPLSWKHSPV